MACFFIEDVMIYDEVEDTPATAQVQGEVAVINDVAAFYLTGNLIGTLAPATLEPLTAIYRARQVLANKMTGSGYAIKHGQKLYYNKAQDKVQASKPAGTYAVDYWFCGWAKRDALASDTTVLMNYDGTRYAENI